jgi:chemotaxis protein CheD
MLLTVDISDMKVSTRSDDIFVTYSLGSCVALSLYDPVAGIGGLIHCMLPLSKIDPAKAMSNPCMFTDLGVQTLLQAVFDLGAKRENLITKVAGGARLLDAKNLFRIGERNYTVLRKVLWKNNILITSEDVGGTISRTVYLYMETGKTIIKSGGKEVEL